MKFRFASLLAPSIFLLSLMGCAGVGVVATTDPLMKLNDAESLFMEQDRPLIAERLIREAIAIYQEISDQHGLGNAHREYGDLLMSSAVVKWEPVYRRDGFQDKSITFDTRQAKATEYYSKALEYYARAEPQLLGAGKFDALTNVYFNVAWTSYHLGDRTKACANFDKSLEAYTENIKRNPTAKQYAPLASVTESIASAKKRVGCA